MKIIAVGLVLASLVTADSAVMYGFPDGRTVAVLATSDLAMVAESVLISPASGMYSEWVDHEAWLPMMDVSCVFHLANLTDSRQDVLVGFPLDAKWGDSYTTFTDSMLVAMFDSIHADEGRMSWSVTGPSDGRDAIDQVPEDLRFTAEVDGTPLEVSYRTCAWSLEDWLVWRPAVAVWEMSFAPGDTVRLVNTYSTSWDYLGFGPDANYSLRYIVTTGASWSGTIGFAVIRMEVPPELPLPQLGDTLMASWWWTGSPEVDTEGRTVTWRYQDWEPAENLELGIHTLEDAGLWWDYIDTGDLALSVNWTPDSLLDSAVDGLLDQLSWVNICHDQLVLHILENVVAMSIGGSVPNPDLNRILDASMPMDWKPDEVELECLETVRQTLEADIELVRDEGLAFFLPLFRLRSSWTVDDLDMFTAMPDLEDAFLRIMGSAQAAIQGEVLQDQAVEAFFRLSGLTRSGPSPWRTYPQLNF